MLTLSTFSVAWKVYKQTLDLDTNCPSYWVMCWFSWSTWNFAKSFVVLFYHLPSCHLTRAYPPPLSLSPAKCGLPVLLCVPSSLWCSRQYCWGAYQPICGTIFFLQCTTRMYIFNMAVNMSLGGVYTFVVFLVSLDSMTSYMSHYVCNVTSTHLQPQIPFPCLKASSSITLTCMSP